MILIASSSSEMLVRCEQGLQGFAAVLTVCQLESLAERLAQLGPRILLLDLGVPRFDGPKSVAAFRKANPATKIIALTAPLSDDAELALFKAGVRGVCRSNIEPQLLKRVVMAIEQGELWIRRSITPRLLDELGARPRDESQIKRMSAGRLADLTQREREIAALIGHGESNKQIARRLAITERTVKAHLTGVFRKLGIADRLKLALQVRSQPESDRERVN